MTFPFDCRSGPVSDRERFDHYSFSKKGERRNMISNTMLTILTENIGLTSNQRSKVIEIFDPLESENTKLKAELAKYKAEIERLEGENGELKYDLDNQASAKDFFEEDYMIQRIRRLVRLLGEQVEENDRLNEELEKTRVESHA